MTKEELIQYINSGLPSNSNLRVKIFREIFEKLINDFDAHNVDPNADSGTITLQGVLDNGSVATITKYLSIIATNFVLGENGTLMVKDDSTLTLENTSALNLDSFGINADSNTLTLGSTLPNSPSFSLHYGTGYEGIIEFRLDGTNVSYLKLVGGSLQWSDNIEGPWNSTLHSSSESTQSYTEIAFVTLTEYQNLSNPTPGVYYLPDTLPPGPQGPQGPEGPQGPQGATGPQGPVGPEGPKGDQGPQGLQGVDGPQGPTGLTGPEGPMGPEGPQGPAGPQGPTGDTGPAGPQGPQGDTGPEGPAGTSITVKGEYATIGDLQTAHPTGTVGDGYLIPDPTSGLKHLWVWDDVNSEWKDSGQIQGPQGPPGDTGAQGPQGEQGAQGPVGPQGDTGATGPAGPQGIQGETGPVGPMGPTGPQGIDGPIGPAGPQGETGPEGPQGPQGETGPQGPEGPQGPKGEDGTMVSTFIRSFTPGWISGLDFKPTAKWDYNGVTYTDSRNLSFDAADPTFDRYDMFAIDLITAELIIIKGTASSDPQEPTLPDPVNQLAGPFIRINAGATEPADMSGIILYAEDLGSVGGEADVSGTASLNTGSTNDKYSGSLSIETTSPLQNGETITFTPDTPIQADSANEFQYWIKNKVGGAHEVLVQGINPKNGKPVNIWLQVPPDYSANLTVAWQLVALQIPVNDLDTITSISIVSRFNGFDFFLDQVRFIDTNMIVANDFVTKDEFNAAIALKADKSEIPTYHFKGLHIDLSSLQTAHPTAARGDYAYVDGGVGQDTVEYIWDEDDTQWVEGNTTGSTETAATIKTKYESNADTNAFTDALLSKLNSITAIFTTALKTAYDAAESWVSTNGQNVLDHVTKFSNNVADQVPVSQADGSIVWEDKGASDIVGQVHQEDTHIWNTADPNTFIVSDSSMVTDVYQNGKRLGKFLEDGVTADEWQVNDATTIQVLNTLSDGDRITIVRSSTSVSGTVDDTNYAKLDTNNLFTNALNRFGAEVLIGREYYSPTWDSGLSISRSDYGNPSIYNILAKSLRTPSGWKTKLNLQTSYGDVVETAIQIDRTNSAGIVNILVDAVFSKNVTFNGQISPPGITIAGRAQENIISWPSFGNSAAGEIVGANATNDTVSGNPARFVDFKVFSSAATSNWLGTFRWFVQNGNDGGGEIKGMQLYALPGQTVVFLRVFGTIDPNNIKLTRLLSAVDDIDANTQGVLDGDAYIEKGTGYLKKKQSATNSKVVVVSTSRNLTADDNGKILLITATVTLTYPVALLASGFACEVDVDSTGSLTIADENATPGADLDAPHGTTLAADSIGTLYVRPDNNKLRLKGEFA